MFFLNFLICVSFPFDWRTPRGYVLLQCVQVITGLAIIEIFLYRINLILGFYLYLIAFKSDMKERFRQFDNDCGCKKNGKSVFNGMISKKINDILRFHAESRG